LKFRGMWEEYDLYDDNFRVEFNVPTNFYDMREAQKLELKINTFNTITGNENISTTFAMKKYLNWSDKEILANRAFLQSDASLGFVLDQLRANGPGWKEMALGGGEAGGDMGGDIGGGMGGGDVPPPFGGGPASLGDEGDMGDDLPPEGDIPEEPIE